MLLAYTGTHWNFFIFLLDSNLLFYFTSKEDETETTLFLKLNQPSTISEIKVRPIGNDRQWYAGTCKQSCRSRFCCVEPNPFFGPAQAPTHTLLKIFYFDRTLSFFCFFSNYFCCPMAMSRNFLLLEGYCCIHKQKESSKSTYIGTVYFGISSV